MKYHATYKCALCGELVDFGRVVDLKEQWLHDLCAFILNSKADITEHITHTCKDGSTGVAYFAGFRRA